MRKQFVSSPHAIIVPNHIRIDCCFLDFLLGNAPCNYGVLKEALPYYLFSLLDIPPIVVERGVIPFHPNDKKCDPSK